MNVGYKHTLYNYKSSTASGLIGSKSPVFPQKHRPAKFSGYVLVNYVFIRDLTSFINISYNCECLGEEH